MRAQEEIRKEPSPEVQTNNFIYRSYSQNCKRHIIQLQAVSVGTSPLKVFQVSIKSAVVGGYACFPCQFKTASMQLSSYADLTCVSFFFFLPGGMDTQTQC